MNQGVEILLSRMDSNPEEFAGEFYEAGIYQRKLGKWEWLVDALKCNRVEDRKVALPYLTDQEIAALHDKYQILLRDNFTKRVMALLLEEDQELSSSFAAGLGNSLKATNKAYTQAIRSQLSAMQPSKLCLSPSALQHLKNQLDNIK